MSLSSGALGWVDSARGLVKVSRADLSQRTVRPEAATAALAVVTDTAAVWLTSGGDPDAPAGQVVSALDGAPAVRGPAAAGDSLGLGPLDGGDVAVIAGSTARAHGVYRFTPGSTQYGALLDEAGAAPPLSLDASSGRLAYAYPGPRSGEQGLFDQGIDRQDGALDERGTERRLATTQGGSTDVTAARTAYLRFSSSNPVAVVQDGAAVTAQVSVEGPTNDIAVSGHRLVTSAYADDGPNPVPGTTYVRDLRDPSAPPRVFRGIESTELSGSRLAFLARDGSIRVRDLDTSVPDVLVRQPGFPPGAETDGRQGRMSLQIAGDFVYWSFPSSQSFDDPPVETRVARISAAGSTARPLDLVPDEVRLADGLLAYLDRDDRDVHLVDLADGADRVVGRARRAAGNRAFLALDPDFLAFVAPDDTTRVVPTSVTAAAPPTLLGGLPSRGFSPDGDGQGELFALGLDASRPLESYDVTGPGGAVVREFSGTAPDGGLHARWDGRDAAGRPVPDGTYTWRVTGSGGTERGELRAGGPGAPLSGRVAVDRVDPARATTSAPARASDTSAKPVFRVSWSGSESGLRFDVDVSRRVRSSSGALSWAPAKRWLTGTSAPSAVYTGTPYAVAAGEELRFTATAVDAAGNRRASGTSPVVVVPYDDRSSLLTYSAGWTTTSSSDRWGGSSRVSGTAGRRVGLTASGTRYDVVGDRCPTCGRFTLLVDGRRRATVDTSSSSTRRRAVLTSVVLPRGRHRIELVVVGVAGRTVRVDAVAVTR